MNKMWANKKTGDRMVTGISSLNNPFSAVNSGLVNGAELQGISRELLAAAGATSVTKTLANLDLSKVNVQPANNGLNVFTKGIDVQTANQIALNGAGQNVQLSQNAVSNIQMLMTEAAKSQFTSVHKNMEGKIYVPNDTPVIGDLKDVFALSTAPRLLNTKSLTKDKRGSNPFDFVPRIPKSQKNQEQEQEQNLSIFA